MVVYPKQGWGESLNLSVTILCWNGEDLGRNSQESSLCCVFFSFPQTAQLHPLWGRECLTSRPKQKTDQASRVTVEGASFTFRGTKTIFPSPTYPAETEATLGWQSCDFFSAAWKLMGYRGGFRKGKEARNLGCLAHCWAGIPEQNIWKAHYSGLRRKWHWGVEGVNRSSRRSVHQSGCGAFRHIASGTNGDQGLEQKSHDSPSQHHPVSLYQVSEAANFLKKNLIYNLEPAI